MNKSKIKAANLKIIFGLGENIKKKKETVKGGTKLMSKVREKTL